MKTPTLEQFRAAVTGIEVCYTTVSGVVRIAVSRYSMDPVADAYQGFLRFTESSPLTGITHAPFTGTEQERADAARELVRTYTNPHPQNKDEN